jgi:hypothetical protein
MDRSALRGVPRVLFMAALALTVAVAILGTSNEGFAAAPLQSKSCDYSGDPACPVAPPSTCLRDL